jgi:hypothetical protein
MSVQPAHAYINLEIARIAKSPTPSPDQSFVTRMIEMAFFLDQLTFEQVQHLKQALETKVGNRVEQLRAAT